MRRPPANSVRPHSAWAPWFFLAPFLIVFATFVAWPLVRSLVLSFEQTYGPRTTSFVGLLNFRFMLQDPLFWRALGNTTIFALGSLFVQLPIAFGLALLLNRSGLRGRAWFRLVFFSPALVGLVFTAVMVALAFEKRTGLVNIGVHALFAGWDPDFPWLEKHVMATLIISALWLYAGFNMVYFLAALQNVTPELLEAAHIDGAGPWQRFRHIILPEIRPVASFVVLLAITGSFQLFELPFIIFSSSGNAAGPNNSALTIVMYLYQNGFLQGDLGYASAIGWVLAVMLMSAALFQRWLARREQY
ncbi:MAG TPA: sugar ABC transporter permease [Opitutaceae bacterium]|nr:sugar ABC transporter permease [Opitutaceae bacterium]